MVDIFGEAKSRNGRGLLEMDSAARTAAILIDGTANLPSG